MSVVWSTGGYTCPTCGMYVSPNAAHYCYGLGNRVDQTADARVAVALERIAAALEALCARAPGEEAAE